MFWCITAYMAGYRVDRSIIQYQPLDGFHDGWVMLAMTTMTHHSEWYGEYCDHERVAHQHDPSLVRDKRMAMITRLLTRHDNVKTANELLISAWSGDQNAVTAAALVAMGQWYPVNRWGWKRMLVISTTNTSTSRRRDLPKLFCCYIQLRTVWLIPPWGTIVKLYLAIQIIIEKIRLSGTKFGCSADGHWGNISHIFIARTYTYIFQITPIWMKVHHQKTIIFTTMSNQYLRFPMIH